MHEDVEEVKLSTQSAEETYLQTQTKVQLLKQLHSLAEPYREVMYLRLFGELSFREIGDILEHSENWARVTFYRGKEMLRRE